MVIGAAMILATALASPAAAPAGVQPDEIVVRAVRDRCRVELAGRMLSDREFAERAKLWSGGQPLRVIEPRGADTKCLAKIAFRLADKGVRLIEFVDRPPLDR